MKTRFGRLSGNNDRNHFFVALGFLNLNIMPFQCYSRWLEHSSSPDLQMVLEIAMRFTESGLDLEELVAAGNLGLSEALREREEVQTIPFLVFAPRRITEAIEQRIALEDTCLLEGNLQLEEDTSLYPDPCNAELEKMRCREEAIHLASIIKDLLQPKSREFEVFCHCFGIAVSGPLLNEVAAEKLKLKLSRYGKLKEQSIIRVGWALRDFRRRTGVSFSLEAFIYLCQQWYVRDRELSGLFRSFSQHRNG